jgi:hypothetical protein
MQFKLIFLVCFYMNDYKIKRQALHTFGYRGQQLGIKSSVNHLQFIC